MSHNTPEPPPKPSNRPTATEPTYQLAAIDTAITNTKPEYELIEAMKVFRAEIRREAYEECARIADKFAEGCTPAGREFGAGADAAADAIREAMEKL